MFWCEMAPISKSHDLFCLLLAATAGGMECPTASPMPVGRSRSLSLLNGVPNRFYDFSRMDQITFVQLADWCMEHKTPVSAAEDISIEECLFIFLDIAGQGTSFNEAAQSWGHPEDIIKKYGQQPPMSPHSAS